MTRTSKKIPKMGFKVNDAQFKHMIKFFYNLSGGEPVPVHDDNGGVAWFVIKNGKITPSTETGEIL